MRTCLLLSLCKKDALSGVGACRRRQGLHLGMLYVAGRHHHAIALDLPHVAWLQVGKHHNHAVLQTRLRAASSWQGPTLCCTFARGMGSYVASTMAMQPCKQGRVASGWSALPPCHKVSCCVASSW